MEEDILTIVDLIKKNPSVLDFLNLEQLESLLCALRNYEVESGVNN